MAGFHVITLGCKVNRVESDSYEANLARLGLDRVGLARADVIIVNTCTVTAEAEKKARKAVRHALACNGHASVLVTGCASAIDPQSFASLDGRVRVVGKDAMGEALGQVAMKAVDESAHSGSQLLSSRTRVGIKVQDGCDNACTYCIVCKARGPSRSIDPARILERVRSLDAEGVKEVVLTGINIGAYDWEGMRLPDLLRSLLEASNEPADGMPLRVRLSSIEPMDVSAELIELMATASGRVCRHLHIPLQSGSSRILAAMARDYDAVAFGSLVARVRDAMPMVSLTTDAIVGFPGEDDEDFELTCDMARACRFSRMHVFPYSPRAGTVAAALEGKVPPETKARRARALRGLADELRRSDALQRAGKEELYLVQEDGMMMSESYFEAPADPAFRVGELRACGFACALT